MSDPNKPLDPKSMTLSDAARVLAASGSQHATAEALQSDIDTGMPTSPDGTLDLVVYAAWLAKEISRRGD